MFSLLVSLKGILILGYLIDFLMEDVTLRVFMAIGMSLNVGILGIFYVKLEHLIIFIGVS